MITRSQEVFGAIVTEALIVDLMPWPCPSYLGPSDRYRLEELLAATGLSLVYRATDLRMSDQGFSALVAIKIARNANRGVVQEGLAIRRISHRHVLAVFDRGIVDDCEYTVTELVEGGTLADRSVPMPAREAATLMVKIARGMQAAHTAGVFHLDLKPANILLTKDGEPKVADFGYGRIEDQVAGPARGNLAFMSPEQYASDENALTFSADIYALGGVLYHLLSGNYPHGDTAEAIAEFHRLGQPVRPPTTDDRVLNLICAKAMERRPEDRYTSADEFASDLESWLRHEPIRWMNLSRTERFGLAYHRNPTLIVASAIAAMFFVAAVWIGAVFTENRLRRDEIADKKATELLEIESQRVRGKAADLAHAILGGEADHFPVEVFILRQLYDLVTIGPDGERPTLNGITQKLELYIGSQETSGQGSAIHTAIAYSALSMLQVECGRWADALKTVASARERWKGVLKDDDQYWETLKSVEFLAKQGEIWSRATDYEQRLGAMQAITAHLHEADPPTEIHRIASGLRKQIDKQLKEAAAENK